MKHITNISEIPKTPHLAVLYTKTYTIPGDERSRTCPGHGYPESTGQSINYVVMDNEDDLAKWIEKRQAYGERMAFTVIRAQAVEVKAKLHVEVGA
jgi:hypothetical protein